MAVDQCKSLLHAGLVAVGYGAVGFKLLAQSAEAVAQRVLARRGCLLKVWAGGARGRREAAGGVPCHLSLFSFFVLFGVSRSASLSRSHFNIFL